MFSLIITIISIALVAALALATIYYGGSAFNRGSDGAKAAQLINEGQQLNGAVAIAKADAAAGGAAVTTLAGLVPSYLAQLPASFAAMGTTAVADGKVAVVTTQKVCEEVQKRATGSSTVGTTEPAQVYGCWLDGADHTFFYKF